MDGFKVIKFVQSEVKYRQMDTTGEDFVGSLSIAQRRTLRKIIDNYGASREEKIIDVIHRAVRGVNKKLIECGLNLIESAANDINVLELKKLKVRAERIKVEIELENELPVTKRLNCLYKLNLFDEIISELTQKINELKECIEFTNDQISASLQRLCEN